MTIYCGVEFHVRQQLIAWCDTPDGDVKFENSSTNPWTKYESSTPGYPDRS